MSRKRQANVQPDAQAPVHGPSPSEFGARFAFSPVGPPLPWTRTTCAGLALLVGLWAFKLVSTWGAWGNLTVDSGHEMYVPTLVAEGKTLYRDTWFMFGPASAWFNGLLFGVFGVHLDVLYWAGSLAALGSAAFLYLTGMRLAVGLVGWTAGAVLLLDAFQPTLFCFPLPYSFAAAYGCLVGCGFLWLATGITAATGRASVLLAGNLAALALLLKPEFGTACYAIVALLIGVRGLAGRSASFVARDVAMVVPGLLTCGLVVWWMVSLAGVEFITHENIVSWPSTYFMKTYGKMWLAFNGFILTIPAFTDAFVRTLPLIGLGVALYPPPWRRLGPLSPWLRAGLAAVVVWYLAFQLAPQETWQHGLEQALLRVVFPKDMVLYVAVLAPVAWWSFWRQPRQPPLQEPGPLAARSVAVPILLTYAGLSAFRNLMNMAPSDYPIFYNGPVVLAFLWLVSQLLPRDSSSGRPRFAAVAAVCLACVTGVALHASRIEAPAKAYVALVTDRGTLKAPAPKVRAYEAAIRFMKEKAALGQSVLSVPEDTSLYFLAGVHCPVRVYSFTPGVIAPGKMTRDTIREIEAQPVRYLLWSNRTFPEYKVPVFGKDFHQELGAYLRAHYRPVGPVIEPATEWDWSAVIWERKPGATKR